MQEKRIHHFQGNPAHGVLAIMQNSSGPDWKTPVSQWVGFLPLTFPRTEIVNWKSAVQLCSFLGRVWAETWKHPQPWGGTEWTSGFSKALWCYGAYSGCARGLYGFAAASWSCTAGFQPQAPELGSFCSLQRGAMLAACPEGSRIR